MYKYTLPPFTRTVYQNNYSIFFCPLSAEDCDAFGDRSTQHDATSESLGVDAPGSSHVSGHNGELKILSVYGKGEGPLAVDGHDTLFTVSKVEAPDSLSVDHSAAQSLDCGEQLVHPEELSVQVGNPLLIHHPEERLPLLQLNEYVLCVSFSMWKAADRRHHFNQG